MLHHPVLLGLVLALIALLMFAVRRAWSNRRVDFIHRVRVHGPEVDDLADALLDRVLPVLAAGGFATVAQGGHTTVLERRYFPGWTILVAVLFFPVGLLALLARGRETVTLVAGYGDLEVRGRCGKYTADYLMDAVEDEATDARQFEPFDP